MSKKAIWKCLNINCGCKCKLKLPEDSVPRFCPLHNGYYIPTWEKQ